MHRWLRKGVIGVVFGIAMVVAATPSPGQDKSDKSPNGFIALDSAKIPAALRAPTDLPGNFQVMLGAKDGIIDTLAVQGQSKQIAMTAPDGKLQLWGIPSLKQAMYTKRVPTKVVCTAYSGKGTVLAMGDANGTIHFWNIGTNPPTARGTVPNAHMNGPIYTIAFTPDGNTLVTGGSDGKVKLWDPNATPVKLKATLEGHTKFVRDLAFTPDGALMATAGADDMTVRMWDLASDPPEQLDVLQHKNPVASVVFSPDGRMFASSCYADGQIRLWRTDEAKPQEIGGFRANRPNVRQVRFTPDGTELLALVKDKVEDEIVRYDLKGSVKATWKFPHHLGGFILTPDGEHIVTLNEDCVYIGKLMGS